MKKGGALATADAPFRYGGAEALVGGPARTEGAFVQQMPCLLGHTVLCWQSVVCYTLLEAVLTICERPWPGRMNNKASARPPRVKGWMSASSSAGGAQFLKVSK